MEMNALWTFAESPFENPKISSAEIFAYTTDHLARMKSGNPDGKNIADANGRMDL